MPTTSPIPPPLTLEEYAAVVARLLQAAGRPTADVLAELNIPLDAWRVTATAWESALDEELARGRRTLLVTFTTHFASMRAALSARVASVPSVEPVSTRREPALRGTSIANAPNLSIASEATVTVDQGQPASPAPPSAPVPAHTADDDRTRRAVAGETLPCLLPPSDTPEPARAVEEPPTVRVPRAPPLGAEVPIPPVGIERPPRSPKWMERLRNWLFSR